MVAKWFLVNIAALTTRLSWTAMFILRNLRRMQVTEQKQGHPLLVAQQQKAVEGF